MDDLIHNTDSFFLLEVKAWWKYLRNNCFKYEYNLPKKLGKIYDHESSKFAFWPL